MLCTIPALSQPGRDFPPMDPMATSPTINDPTPGGGAPESIFNPITLPGVLPAPSTPAVPSKPVPSVGPHASRPRPPVRPRPPSKPRPPTVNRPKPPAPPAGGPGSGKGPGDPSRGGPTSPTSGSDSNTKTQQTPPQQPRVDTPSCPQNIDRYLKTKAGRELKIDARCLQNRKYKEGTFREIVQKRKRQIMDEGTKKEYLEVIKKSNPPTSLARGLFSNLLGE